MMPSVRIGRESLEELAELRRRHHEATRLVQESGNTAVTRMLAFVVTRAGQVWEETAPRLTGTLASATREQVFGGEALIYIDPTVENPVFGGYPAIYGPIVHDRRPWVENLINDRLPSILQKGAEQLFEELSWAYRV